MPATAATLNGKQSEHLNATGKLTLANGRTVHRPLNGRDHASETDDTPRSGARLRPTELTSLTAVFQPLAQIETQQADLAERERAVRYDADTRKRGQLPKLAEQSEQLKGEHAKARGLVRLSMLAAIEAAAVRAGDVYRAACQDLADAAAELEALATLRDDLTGQANFDPLGAWVRSALLAPPLPYRGHGWAVTSDVWGRDVFWSADSPRHHDAVRQKQQAMRQELESALSGARWPFET